tara:strand:- start:6286 stop:6522 length:237 start_codon:yes stop_codon:yes gene_type:complete
MFKNLKKGLKSIVSKHNESKKVLTPKHIKEKSPIKYPTWLNEGLGSSEKKGGKKSKKSKKQLKVKKGNKKKANKTRKR